MRQRLRPVWMLAVGLATGSAAAAAQQAPDGRGAAEAGSSWSTPRRLLAGGSSCPRQHRPALVLRGDGTTVAVWYDSLDSGLARLLWAERARDADRWSVPRPVGPFALGYWDDGPARLTKLADGSLVLAWRAGAADPEARRPLRLARLDRVGGSWQMVPAPAGTSSVGNDFQLTAGRDGLLAVWADDAGVAYARRGVEGAWTRPERLRSPGRKVRVETSAGLTPMATSGFAPVIAIAPSGTVLVGWWDDERTIGTTGGHPFDLVFRVREPGRDWSAVATVPGARSSNPEASAAATRRGFTLVSAGSDQQLQARSFQTGRWSAATTIPDGLGRGRPSRRCWQVPMPGCC